MAEFSGRLITAPTLPQGAGGNPAGGPQVRSYGSIEGLYGSAGSVEVSSSSCSVRAMEIT